MHVVDKQVIINQIFRDHGNLLMVIVMNGPKAVVTDAYLAGIGFREIFSFLWLSNVILVLSQRNIF